MKNFSLVTLPIESISSIEVTFIHNPNKKTFLRRLHNGTVIWKLTDKGIAVRNEFVEAYGLN